MFSLLTQFIVFSLLYTISCISYTFYICQTIQSGTHYSRERAAVNMQGTVVTLPRFKIVPSYHQELVAHPMRVDELSSLDWIKLQPPFPNVKQAAFRSMFLSFGLRISSRFLPLTTNLAYLWRVLHGHHFLVESVKSYVASRVMNVRHIYRHNIYIPVVRQKSVLS